MKKKKVLISSYNLDYGGIETSLVSLLNNFNYEKYNVTLVLEKYCGVFKKDIPDCISIKEYSVCNNKNIIIRKIINMFKRLKWLMFNYHKYYASICYATYSGPCGFVARTSSKNSILYVHSNYYEAYNKDEKKVREFFDNLKIEKYNHIIFVSNESKKDLIKIYPSLESKSITINNLVDYKRVLDLSNESINIEKDDNIRFLFLGRLDESSKRLSLLLDAAKKSFINKEKFIFWIVGDGPNRKEYEKYACDNKLNNVIFFGAKENPYPYIKACNYVILTSKYEGFPVIYNEAIILSKPIITTVDVSDDYISIPNRFGYVIDEERIYDCIKEITKKHKMMIEKVDYEILNKKRISLIEKIMESKK